MMDTDTRFGITPVIEPGKPDIRSAAEIKRAQDEEHRAALSAVQRNYDNVLSRSGTGAL